jgi:tetratricopeptide (TPR) repeat protein
MTMLWCGPLAAQMAPPAQLALPDTPIAAPALQPAPQPPAISQTEAALPTTQPTEAMRADYDAAFQETLQKPSDPAVLVKFAGASVQVGDIEGAISALERLLLIDGEQADVKLELGVLYYRLGSTEAARSYLEASIASPEASTATKERAQTFLTAISNK